MRRKKKSCLFSPEFPDNFIHHQVIVHRNIARDGISGTECETAVSSGLFHNICDVFLHFRPGQTAYRICVNAPEVPDSVSVFFHPDREGRNLVLVRMLGIDPGGDQVVHHIEDAAAGMQQEGLSPAMHFIDDLLILGDDMADNIVGGNQGIALEAQVIAETQNAEVVRKRFQEIFPARRMSLRI